VLCFFTVAAVLAFVVAKLIHDGMPRVLWQIVTHTHKPIPKPLAFKEYTEAVYAEIVTARAAAKSDDHAGAVAHYTAALALEPGPNSVSVYLHIMRGSQYNFLGDATKAFADFDQAIKTGYPIGPFGDDGIRAFMGRGYAAVNLGKYARAKDDFDAVLEKLPHDVPRSSSTLAWRGAAHQGLGDRAHAVADYKASLALDPTNGYAKQALQALGEP
jgi:tetratricopeptide (TPR) repeat protein